MNMTLATKYGNLGCMAIHEKNLYVISDSRKKKTFGTCFEFVYANLLASGVSATLALETIGTERPDPKVLLLIYEFIILTGTWRFRKIATYQNGRMIACDHRRKEFRHG